MSTTNEIKTTSRWTGFAKFAGFLLVLTGAISLVQGIAAIIGPDTYFAALNGKLLILDVAGWGWWNIIIGAGLFLTGIAVLRGVTWGRIVAVVLAGLSAVGQVILLPLQPWWALIIIALDVLIAYALLAHGRELGD